MEAIARPPGPDKPPDDTCRDPVIARAILGLIETVERQAAQIQILESRLAECEHGLEQLEAAHERALMQ